MNKTIAVHMLMNLWHFFPVLCKTAMWNDHVLLYRTWTTTANFLYFHLELNAIVSCIYSLSKFLESLAYQTDQENRKFRALNIKSLFTRCHPWHHCCCCLSSLIIGLKGGKRMVNDGVRIAQITNNKLEKFRLNISSFETMMSVASLRKSRLDP